MYRGLEPRPPFLNASSVQFWLNFSRNYVVRVFRASPIGTFVSSKYGFWGPCPVFPEIVCDHFKLNLLCGVGWKGAQDPVIVG